MNPQATPLVTFVVLAFNQGPYVSEAVQGALAQTYSPLEILLSDDCSTDQTFETMQQIAREYVGPHKVTVSRNPTNLGLCGHTNRAFSLATGDIVVLAGGDDVSLHTRVADTVVIFQQHPDVASVSLKLSHIESNGRVFHPCSPFVGEGRFTLEGYLGGDRPPGLGASRAYLRTVYTAFGPLSAHCRVEDEALVFRALLTGTVWHSNRVGVKYRVHDKNLSYEIGASAFRSLYRQNANDLRLAESLGAIAPDMLVRTRLALRDMMIRGLIASRFHKSRFKLWILFHRILFSRRFSRQAKKGYVRTAIRQFIPRAKGPSRGLA